MSVDFSRVPDDLLSVQSTLRQKDNLRKETGGTGFSYPFSSAAEVTGT